VLFQSRTAAAIVSPKDGATLNSTIERFEWDDIGAVAYYLKIGSVPGGADFYYGACGKSSSAMISNLPNDGSLLHVELTSRLGFCCLHKRYRYMAANGACRQIITPVEGAVLPSTSVTFEWHDIGASEYRLYVGTEPGMADLDYIRAPAGNTAVKVEGLPENGLRLYVKLFSKIDGRWMNEDYEYIACHPA
jgi:hypothetical protein